MLTLHLTPDYDAENPTTFGRFELVSFRHGDENHQDAGIFLKDYRRIGGTITAACFVA
jgi:hypothetical protein